MIVMIVVLGLAITVSDGSGGLQWFGKWIEAVMMIMIAATDALILLILQRFVAMEIIITATLTED